ncbi:hypothetical protein FP828_05095 [bacterium]|nr:hypothetical protein [bacterium]
MVTILRLVLGLFLLFFAPLVYADEIFDCIMNTDPYPILTDGDGNITVQGKVNYAIYTKEAKMSDLFKKTKNKSNRKKNKIPEYVVSQDFLAIKRKDVPAICKNFSKKERPKAKKRYEEKIENISRFYKVYTDLEFFNKSYWGNYNSIAYNCIGGPKGKTFPAWCNVKFVDGRYYVTRDIDDYKDGTHIFSFLDGLHPWSHGEEVLFKHSDKKFMVNLIFYAEDNKGREIKENPVSLSYNSVPYPPDHSIFLKENKINDEESAFFYKVVETFRKGSDEELLHIWHPDDRENIAEQLSSEKQNILTNITQFRWYFKKVEDIYIVDKIFSSDGVIIYYEPIIKEKRAPLQTIIFKKSNHNYFLAADIRGYREYSPIGLLQSKYILDSIKERLEERKSKR